MATPIKGTPTLAGAGAEEVLREMRLTGSHDYSDLRASLEKAVAVSRSVFRVGGIPIADDGADEPQRS